MAESISEKIADILNVAPTSIDPEDDINEESTARVISKVPHETLDEEDEIIGSKFRKETAELLEDVDVRYKGKTSSRNKLVNSNDWDIDSENDAAYSSELEEEDQLSESNHEDSDQNSMQDESTSNDESGENEDDSVKEDYEASDVEIDQAFKHLETTNTSKQISKGTSVRHQLNVWEGLLEMRIQLQKCLLTANKFPQQYAFNDLKEKCRSNFIDKISEGKKNVTNLLDKFLELQLLMLKKYPETKTLIGNNEIKEVENDTDDDEEIPSDTDDEQNNKIEQDSQEETPAKKVKILDYSMEIDKRHKLYRNYRNSVIQKWNDKTRLAVNKSNEVSHSVINQIDYILSDKEKLIKRTQLKRTKYEIVGQHKVDNDSNKSNEDLIEVYDPHIFDDTDFYHHLLRELIEYKAADVTDPVQLGRRWMQLQSMRSKMKRKIDTRATKGRKIRYAVHSKLVNFMAPIENNNYNIAATDLSGSLFGKNKVF